MSTLFALNVEFEGRSEIFRLEYATNWMNLEAMLKCYLDVGDISIKYMDDEDDEIYLNSEEELTEAKTVAKKQLDVLRLKVTRKTSDAVKPQAAEESSSGRADPVETIDPEIQVPVVLEKSNPRVPVQCSSRPQTIERTPSTSSTKRSSYYADLVTTAGLLQAAKKQVPPTPLTPAVALANEMEPAAAVSGDTTPAAASSSETSIPDELVDRVVRSVLNGLNGAVTDAMCGKSSPKVIDQSDDGKQAKRVFCHLGIICDTCNKTIVGVRYKCGHCSDYDLCEECEATDAVHNPSHVFLKLRQPANKGLGLKTDGRMAPLLKRPIYNDDSSATVSHSLKRLEEKMARKAAKAELKRKFKEEKRRYRGDIRHMTSPTKRECLERMAERQVEEILQAAHVIGTPQTECVAVPQGETVTDVVTVPQGDEARDTVCKGGEKDGSAETSKLFMRWKMDAVFVNDGNLPDDTHMQPGTKFVKSWVMQNTGPTTWNEDTKLKFLWGNMCATSPDAVDVPPVAPGEEGLVCAEFVAPSSPGQYQSHWRLSQDGEHFGHRVWCSITVKRQAPTDEPLQKVEDASQEASSNAVAHLQTNQQDPSIPMRVCSSTEMLTAQDVLSFEMLKISDHNRAETEIETEVATLTHQPTPTPHNTPLGVTPCISPVRELDANILSRHMSEHSDMEIIEVPTEEGEDIEQDDAMPAPGGVETDCAEQPQDDDVETLSTSGSSDDLLDDFEVVPLPDCFDPSKPLETSISERQSSVTGTQTLLTLMEPLPLTPKQDACVSAVTSCNTVATDAPAFSSTTHSECQTIVREQRDAASSANPSSITVGTDVDALCPTTHCEAQTDSLASTVSVASGEESFVQVTSSEMQTKVSCSPTRRDVSVAAVASSRCVATSAGSFLNIASSVTQTESCMSQDATTATATPVSVAVATSVDALFNMAHTEAQTVSCIQRDAMTHATPATTTVSTDVDALFTTAHSGVQTTLNHTKDATTVTAAPSSNTVATNVDALFNTSHAHSQTTPSPVQDALSTVRPSSASVATDIDELFNTASSEAQAEPLIPSQVRSPLQIIRIITPPVTFDTETMLASDQSQGGIVINPFDEALDQPPKIVDITGQLGTNVDKPNTTTQATGERDHEVFHDAVEPGVTQDPSGSSELTESVDIDQDPMEALGYTAQKAMEFAGGFVKQAFGHAAMSVTALLNPQPLPKQQEWPVPASQSTDPEDKMVEMGFGNRQRNKELLQKHNGNISLCVQELLQEQDDSWHACRH